MPTDNALMRGDTGGFARPLDACAITTGRVLAGRYELQRHVASGGMASVWEATDRVLGRQVAVKVLHPHLAADPAFLERFRAEGRSAARLSHAAVVAIYDTVSEPGCEAIVMELVEGQTLRSFLDTNGPLAFGDAVAVVDQVAGALEAAHDAGIVHRDVKPGNILLCADRRVKVTDFGIAKAAADPAAHQTSADHTTDGVVLGTAKYLAPEQVAGQAVDGRADLYSLGVVLYETLTGTVPFDGDTPAATALARLERDAPPITSRRAGIPPGLVVVVDTALARDPADRFASAAVMRTSLAAALVPPPPPVVDPTMVLTDVDRAAVGQHEPAPAAPEPRRAPDPVVVGERDTLRGLLVGAVVVGAFVLGITLFAATTIGRDLYDRAWSTVTDTIVNDRGSGPAQAPPAAAEPGEVGEPVAPVADAVADSPADGISIVSVADFDPEGDGREHPDRTPRAADGAPGTFWHSERYDSRQFGNLKSGVGLVVALDGTRPVNRLEVVSPTRGWAGRVFVSDGAAAELGGWGQPVDGRVGVDGTVRFDLRGVVGSHLLVWFTDLGDELPRPRIEIAELTVS
ncbi:MAG: protein kinase domain-containing protein [Acidimicrobiales bacterium]